MPSLPDDRFPLPEGFGPGSVWADRTGHRTLVGRTQRGVEPGHAAVRGRFARALSRGHGPVAQPVRAADS